MKKKLYIWIGSVICPYYVDDCNLSWAPLTHSTTTGICAMYPTIVTWSRCLALKHISIPCSWLPFQPNRHKLTAKVKVKHQHKHSKEGKLYIEQVSNHHRFLYIGCGRVCMSLGWLIIISNRNNTFSVLVHSRTRQLSLGHCSEKMILTALPVEWA